MPEGRINPEWERVGRGRKVGEFRMAGGQVIAEVFERIPMNIKIEIIPHEQHRYTTVGDWLFDPNGDLTIRVSKLSDWRREMLVAIHELVEVVLCKQAGITQEQVDKFDMEEFSYDDHPDEEPGDSPDAPYKRQHCIATAVERLLAAEMVVDWKTYEDELEALPEIPEK